MHGPEPISEVTRNAIESLVQYLSSIEDSLRVTVKKFKEDDVRGAHEDLIDFADHMDLVSSAIIEIINSINFSEKSLGIDQFQEGFAHLISILKEFTNRQAVGNNNALVMCIEDEILPSLKTWRTFYIPSLGQSV